MKCKMNLFLLLLFFFVGNIYSRNFPRIDSVVLSSNEMNQKRLLFVYTPFDYDENSLYPYDVIYVFDSQSQEIFDFVHSSVALLTPFSKDYIVVGITSMAIDSTDYGRNFDLLPVPVNVEPQQFFNGYFGNKDKFMNYVEKEVIPFIEDNYRTRSKRLAVGHSLSASFVMSCLLEKPDLFDVGFAVSPNLAYDKERLLTDFMGTDFEQGRKKKFLYVSTADEGNYWKEWGPAYDKFYSFMDGKDSLGKVRVVTRDYPTEGHRPVFVPSFVYGFGEFLQYDSQLTGFSEDVYDVVISLTVANEEDEVYITGNQLSLANWQPDEIKMERVSDTLREVRLQIHSPAEIKFTRGSWDTQGWVRFNNGYENLYIEPDKQSRFDFELYEWADD